MELLLKRRYKGPTYTVGSLYLNGKYFCDTIEDKVRDLTKEPKVKHQTAIPEGTYKVIVNRSPKFKRELPRLLNVPHFEGILIHGVKQGAVANQTHSSGCILVGENKVVGGLINSHEYTNKLVALLKGGTHTIKIE